MQMIKLHFRIIKDAKEWKTFNKKIQTLHK